MGIEIERKFLVISDEWRAATKQRFEMDQGYLSAEPVVRVRRARDDFSDKAYLTIKQDRQNSLVRDEFEYEIPVDDALGMLALCTTRLTKTRFYVSHGGLIWHVDYFCKPLGLVIAEIELDDPAQEFDKPAWLGEEVTDDPRYLNANLAKEFG